MKRSVTLPIHEACLNILNGDYLFSSPTDAPSGYFGAFTAGIVIVFLAAAFAYWRRAKIAPDNSILRRFIRRASTATMWVMGFGIFFAIMRYIQFPYLGDPFWMLLVCIAAIVMIGYFVYDRSERYPVAAWQVRQSTQYRKYRPAPKVRAQPQHPQPKVRGKRRR